MSDYTDAKQRLVDKIEIDRHSPDPRVALAAETLADMLTVALGEPTPAPAPVP